MRAWFFRHAGAWRVGAGVLAWMVFSPWLGAVVGGETRVSLPGSIKEIPTAQPSNSTALIQSVDPSVPVIMRTNLAKQEEDSVMTFEVALKMRNFGELQQRIARGETISNAEMGEKYFPLPEDYDNMIAWLTGQGFTITREDGNNLAIFASGTVAKIADVFDVSFARVAMNDKEYTSATTVPSVPTGIAGMLVGINGLQPHIKMHRQLKAHAIQADSATGNVPPFFPGQIAKAYGADTLGLTGAGQTIAIVGSAFPDTNDLTQFWSTCGIKQSLDNVSLITVGAGPLPGSHDNIDGEEANLDVEWSTSIAPQAKVRHYGINNLSSESIDEAYAQIYNDVIQHPEFGIHELSLSYGGTEGVFPPSQLQTDAQYFAELTAAGVTVFASSGDSGEEVSSPASDVNVTGVGGTSITLDQATGAITSETVWPETGGGISNAFSRPVWQNGTGIYGSQRMVPDVAAPADPGTGALIVYTSNNITSNLTVGGTSWGTPVWAAFCALINQSRLANSQPVIGLLNAKIYKLIGSDAFNDITVGHNFLGNNVGDSATVGYDLCTGIGTPRMAELLGQLNNVLSIPEDVVVMAGQDATFSVSASGTTLTYQWQRLAVGNSVWNDLADVGAYNGSTTASLVVNDTTATMSGDQFRCVIGTDGGSVATPSATLVVIADQLYVSTIGGQPGVIGNADGNGAAALFALPNDVAFDAHGNLWIADTLNNTVRKMTTAGQVITVAGMPGVSGNTNGTGNVARFNFDNSLDIDLAGNIYVADSANDLVRRVTPAGVVTTVAGRAGISGNTNGTKTAARFNFPAGIAVASSGNIFVADSNNNLIRRVTPGGVVTTVAGQAGITGSADGIGTSASFNFPAAIAVDTSGNMYVADAQNNVIRKITPGGNVTTFAGLAPFVGSADGVGTSARFNYPSGIAVDHAGNVYVTDTNNNSIRKITPGGVVTTLVGGAGVGSDDGVGNAAQFNQPYGVVVDTTGNIYIADTFNDTLRKVEAVTAPQIQQQPSNPTSISGNTAIFSVVVSAAPPPEYQWQVFAVGGTGWSDLSDDETFGGTTTATLSINATTADMNGDQFQCVVDNGYGNLTTHVAMLTVVETPDITVEPQNTTVETGHLAAFSIEATGTPVLSYQWQLLPAGDSVWGDLADDANINGSASVTLTINSTVTGMNGNELRCVVSNDYGNQTSDVATLIVFEPAHLTVAPQDTTVDAGQPVTFNIVSKGTPTPTYQWQRLPAGGSVWGNLTNDVTYNGTTTAALTVNATTVGMSGDMFRVVINNGYGMQASDGVTLTVVVPVQITVEPQNVILEAGQSASFSIEATGTPAPTYQWQLLPAESSVWGNLTDDTTYNGTTTATLTINAITFAINGNAYRCVAANGVGASSVSDPAILAVFPQGYLTWAGTLSLTGANIAPDAKVFNDGLPNLARFAMNLGASSQPGQLPAVSRETIGGVPFLSLQYRVTKNLTGVQVVVQYSYDIMNWQTLPPEDILQLVDDDDVTASYKAHIAIPVTGPVALRLQFNVGP